MLWQVNTREDYDVIEADALEVDEAGQLIAILNDEVVAGWAPGFWYGYKTQEDSHGQEQQEGQERQGQHDQEEGKGLRPQDTGVVPQQPEHQR